MYLLQQHNEYPFLLSRYPIVQQMNDWQKVWARSIGSLCIVNPQYISNNGIGKMTLYPGKVEEKRIVLLLLRSHQLKCFPDILSQL